MKKNLLSVSLFYATISSAQIQPMGGGAQPMGAPLTQTWTTTPMTVSSGNEAKLGTQNGYPLKFYTNGSDQMEIGTNGQLKILNLSNSTPNGGMRVLYVDDSGILYSNFVARQGTGQQYPSSQCLSNSIPWYEGGNSIGNMSSSSSLIGPCTANDFILQANGNKSIFIKTDGRVNLGVDNDVSNNATTNAALDISAPLANNPNSNQRHHLRLYGDESGIVESTSGMNLYFSNTDVFTINSGVPNNSTSIFEIVGTGIGGGSGGNAYLYTNANISGKTTIGGQTQVGGNHANAMLTVNGKTVSKSFIATQLNWADYVFDKNYKLMPLTELENYYKENKRLPRMPSANEITKNGNDLGNTDALLLEKIEELTLYIVELQKQINDLKKKTFHRK